MGIYYVFFALRANLFAQNQSKRSCMEVLARWNKRLRFESERNKVVSSAKERIFSLVQFLMSFMYIKNNKGPKMEPWGTPHFIGKQSDICES